MPSGKTNLIALDLGSEGNPIDALQRTIELAKGNLDDHVVVRELIALSDGSENAKPVLGMFLGGAGLADTILYCRNKIYPLGLPNGLSHFIAGIAVFLTSVVGLNAKFLPARSEPVKISFLRNNELQGIFSILIVTTLEKLLLGGKTVESSKMGRLKFMAVDHRTGSLFRAVYAAMFNKLGKQNVSGIHIEQGDEIRIDSARSNVVLDGEIFEANSARPIILRSTPPIPFITLTI